MTAAASSPRTLDRPGARVVYDLRPAAAGWAAAPPLALIGSPMGAAGFAALAERLADRDVLLVDPRGSGRSVKDDPTAESSPEQHAADLEAVLEDADVGPVAMLASSGGAVNALALVARRPDLVTTLVAHEPPLASVVPDREAMLAAVEAVRGRYAAGGFGAGMAAFIALSSHQGELAGPLPEADPARFGLPAHDDGGRADVLLGQNLRSTATYVPDEAALRAASTRIVLAAGEQTGAALTARAAAALAERLDAPLVRFPGGHTGFAGDDRGEPDAFAERLREVLAEAGTAEPRPTPKAYWVSVYRSVSDPGRLAAYNALAAPAVRDGGGRTVVRGGRVAAYDDGLAERVVLVEFDSFEQAVAARDSPAYAEALAALGDAVERDFRIVEGVG